MQFATVLFAVLSTFASASQAAPAPDAILDNAIGVLDDVVSDVGGIVTGLGDTVSDLGDIVGGTVSSVGDLVDGIIKDKVIDSLAGGVGQIVIGVVGDVEGLIKIILADSTSTTTVTYTLATA